MKTFALFVAPWDLAEHGTDELLRWAKDQGINTIYLASVYHAGWFLHPNFRRKAYMVEDGACYFRPTLSRFQGTPLVPRPSRWCAERNWLMEARQHTRRLNMKLVLWTVCTHNTALGMTHPGLTCQNVYGDRYPHALCPSHPAVREYVRALCVDQAAQFEPDGFLLEATGYHRGRTHGSPAGGIAGHHHERDGLPMPALEQHLLNLSFTETDCRAAEDSGIDTARLRNDIRRHLDGFFASAPRRPAGAAASLMQFQQEHPALARYESVLLQQAAGLVTAVKDQNELRGITLMGDTPRPAFDSVLVGCYNLPPASAASTIQSVRQQAGPDKPLIAGLRLGFNPPPAAASINSRAQAVGIARAIAGADADGIAFYFYGEAPASSLAWIKPMIDAAISTRAPQQPSAASLLSSTSIKSVRVGLFGAGAIGEVHLKALALQPGVELRSIFDPNMDKAARLARQFSIAHTARTADEILNDAPVDLIVVAAPPNSHVQLARRVLESGRHLLIEKPLGMNLADADAIADAALASGAVCGVALVHRYDGNRFAARDLIRNGAIGKVRLIRHRWGQYMYDDPRFASPRETDRRWLVDASIAGGGMLPSASIHTLSLLSFLLGGARMTTVGGSVRQVHPRAFPGIEDDVSLQIQFEGGAEAMIDESWAANHAYDMSIQGDDGELRIFGPTPFQISLTGTCRGPIPQTLEHLFVEDRITSRPGELDDRVPPLFEGLSTDLIAAVRGQGRGELPDVLHARNMRAVITAAIEASSSGSRTEVAWRHSAQPQDIQEERNKHGISA